MPELHLERDIALPVDRVFAAWTRPELLGRWFAPGDRMTCVAQTDLRVGGHYRIAMHDPDAGEDHVVMGQYSVVEPDRRLAFSWRWESSEHTTQVDVRFASLGDKTRVSIRHTEFTEQEICDKHSTGWNGCLSSLEAHVDQLAA